MVTDRFYNTYRNQHGELVAEVRWSVMNFMRQQAKAQASDGGAVTLPHPWAVEEVEEIERQVLSEEPRGDRPRLWEDVSIGDHLDVVTKGPIGMTDEVAYVAAGGPPIPRVAANAVSLHQYQRHPAWAFRDPGTMALEPIYAVHYNRAAANAMGVALQYDVGFQRQCWHIHLLTNWMGDHAWIRQASAQYRRFVYHGDVISMGGEVTAKHVTKEGEHCVDIRTWAPNQRDEETMPGTATIALPTMRGPSPAERRGRGDQIG
jgi:hypothetical protein